MYQHAVRTPTVDFKFNIILLIYIYIYIEYI